MILQVDNLKAGYKGGFFIKDINFDLEKNDFIGVIGPNGSGKTTLFRSLTRLLNLEEGNIFFEGKNLKELKPQEIAKKIAIVSQNTQYMPDLTVEEYVLLGRIPQRNDFQFFESKSDIEVVEKALDLTQTSIFKKRKLMNLSGGEKQLVMIARALAQEPRLLLLDEPTNHLDIAHQVRLLDLLKKLNKENDLTVLLILHDLNLASEYCEKILLLHQGKIKIIGEPEQVLTYQNIEQVYSTTVVVRKNPLSNNPLIFFVSDYIKRSVK